MINELQRQVYLSTLGIDSYMPRVHLDFAPASFKCELPELIFDEISPVAFKSDSKNIPADIALHDKAGTNYTPINNLINDIFDKEKTFKASAPINNASKVDANLAINQVVDAFSLSVWQPFDGLIIVDSRDTKLALPTEMLCKNILNLIFPDQVLSIKEEILRCPMIENSFVKRTAADARAELQTWFSVQREIHEIKYVWLMGSNASRYLIADNQFENLCQTIPILDSAMNALILPSLNELLINPLLKKSLFTALRQYHL